MPLESLEYTVIQVKDEGRDGRAFWMNKAPYRDCTTHVIFESLDFIARP